MTTDQITHLNRLEANRRRESLWRRVLCAALTIGLTIAAFVLAHGGRQ